jgi:6-pyruvoyltetrahydropterin/6-carboxytetrahydropterin synthase
MFEVSKQFRFEAAHTLRRAEDDNALTSSRIHGHSYRAEVVVRGEADPQTGMVIDFAALERAIDAARLGLDHHYLNDVSGLGPATMENLSIWIWRKLAGCAGLVRVSVYRDSTGETCSYFGPGDRQTSAQT